MSIKGWNEEQKFGIELNNYISLSTPIDKHNFLFGRDENLKEISRALMVPGRHVFIIGDRGIGKTSLALTAATDYCGKKENYIQIGCSGDSNFHDIISNIIYRFSGIDRIIHKERMTQVQLKAVVAGMLGKDRFEPKDIRLEINSVTDAVEFLGQISKEVTLPLMVVIDEFDKLSLDCRLLFADTVKLLGDRALNIKFIFTGIASDIDVLLEGHASSIRNLETVELEKLSYDNRWKILQKTAERFGLEVDREVLIKVSIVCDGYPYYVHLITEKLLWESFDADQAIEEIDLSLYRVGLEKAVQKVTAQLKQPYKLAIAVPNDDNEEVVWSTADTDLMDRHISEMRASYLRICKERNIREPLDSKQYSSRISSLRKKGRGSVLTNSFKRGWHTYTEKMLRGYVRMQAAANDIELISNLPEDVRIPSAQGTNTRTGFKGSHPPRGFRG